MKELELGHIYELDHLEGPGKERLTFKRRSSKAIDYGDGEHEGTNSQEVLRALIARSKRLDQIIPSVETRDAIYYARMVLFCYEARAYRRKLQKLNKSAEHNSFEEHYDDIPFSEYEIELWSVGPDGHIVLTEEEIKLGLEYCQPDNQLQDSPNNIALERALAKSFGWDPKL